MHGSSATCNCMAAPHGPFETISYLGQIEWKKYLSRLRTYPRQKIQNQTNRGAFEHCIECIE